MYFQNLKVPLCPLLMAPLADTLENTVDMVLYNARARPTLRDCLSSANRSTERRIGSETKQKCWD